MCVCVCVCVCLHACSVAQSYLTLCDPMDCSLLGSSVHEDSPGQNTGVGSLSLLQGIILTQESNRGLLHCRWILYQRSYQGHDVRKSNHYAVHLKLTQCYVNCISLKLEGKNKLKYIFQKYIFGLGRSPGEGKAIHFSILAWRIPWTL